MGRPLHLLSLPADVLQAILDHTPYHSQHALRLTHRIFTTLITPTALGKAHAALRDHLLHCERTGTPFPTNLAAHFKPPTPRTLPLDTAAPSSRQQQQQQQQQHQYPCYTCLLPLPVTHFTPRQLSSTRKRICIDCAVTSGRWPPGTSVAAHVVCALCGGFKPQTARKEGRRSWLRGREAGDAVGGTTVKPPAARRVACDECFEAAVMRGAELERGRFGDGGCGVGRGRVSRSDEAQMRRGRCQRCWAIDHTERPVDREVQGRPLCEDCFGLVAS